MHSLRHLGIFNNMSIFGKDLFYILYWIQIVLFNRGGFITKSRDDHKTNRKDQRDNFVNNR